MITRIPTVVVWALGAVTATSLGATAGQVFWRMNGDDSHMRAPAPPPLPNDVARLDLSAIFAFSPFGSSVVADPVQEVTGETSLGLVLLGVTISVPTSGSRAIISGGEDPARGYFVGEIIAPSVSLSAIEADHVLLDVDGQLETLSFSKTRSTIAPEFDSDEVSLDGPDLENLIPSTDEADAAVAVSDEPEFLIARYRDAIETDVRGVLDMLGLEATDEGYRITESASEGVLQAGFQPGDLVTRVNGQKVGDMSVDQLYFDEVAASGRARVETLRDGETIVMSFPLR